MQRSDQYDLSDLSAELQRYAAQDSFNGEGAVVFLRKAADLLPVFARNIGATAAAGSSNADRYLAVIADQVSAMTGLPPTAQTLAPSGFQGLASFGESSWEDGPFMLSKSKVRVPFEITGEMKTSTAVLLREAKAYNDELTQKRELFERAGEQSGAVLAGVWEVHLELGLPFHVEATER